MAPTDPHAARLGAAHVPGTMDVAGHERTYNAFIGWVRRVTIAVVVILLFLALVGT